MNTKKLYQIAKTNEPKWLKEAVIFYQKQIDVALKKNIEGTISDEELHMEMAKNSVAKTIESKYLSEEIERLKRSKANSDIRARAKAKNVLLWQIALKLGINDGNFSRKLRKELSAEEKAKIFSIIDELSLNKNQESGNNEQDHICTCVHHNRNK